MAHTAIYQQLNRQAAVLGYSDVYRVLCWMSIGMIACTFLLNRTAPAKAYPPARPCMRGPI